MKTGHPTLKDFVFVGLQLVLFIIYILPLKFVEVNLPEGLQYFGLLLTSLGFILSLVAVLQINTKISPFPTPKVKSTLRTTGAFKISRHPIYTGILAITLGYAMFNASVFKLLIGLSLWVLFYFKSKDEEELLQHMFPEYKTYKTKTRRFI
ncbi:methyltransferase family protein [Formosa algae]|uniref:methyltransferase family protein n=1 Tax=Formosa algae TaxID=225843 RepID=UPI000CCE36DA|nr:isoprenylcysteine carboxylmethyltransferase family protein [Formosa algae]PNW29016.1 protein-S-isoprenylcysteine methyltransferase [Formosa algae]